MHWNRRFFGGFFLILPFKSGVPFLGGLHELYDAALYCRTMSETAMIRRPFVSCFLLLGLIFACVSGAHAQPDDGWETPYESSGCISSPRYDATMAFLKRMAGASSRIRVASFGVTPQGRDLPLVIVSGSGAFTPDAARKSGLPVVLIQSGIHAGEIDGKDASLMLIRDIAIRKSLRHLAAKAVLLFMPIFNLDGHERQSRYNRINQNGPEEMGWRVTANNLNLNRDFLKADAPEMRAWLRAFNTWKPDMVIDIHVTDGIDFQYNLTYSMEMHANAPASVVRWQKTLERAFIAGMASQGDPVCPYVWPREESDLSKGLLGGAAPPRFSTGYAAIRNRAALLVETHMLKPYKARVTATYRLLKEVLGYINDRPDALRSAVDSADNETVRRFSSGDTARFPLSFRVTERHTTLDFLGYESSWKESSVSGGKYLTWDHAKPTTVTIPLFNVVEPAKTVQPPFFYLIPQEWNAAIEVLRLHGVRIERLTREQRIPVRISVFSKLKWRESSYEGRHPVGEFQSTLREDTIAYPAGTYVVRLDQPSAKAVIHLLEPDGPDSFVAWGFFDAIFEQKEYYEEYVMASVAEQMATADPSLKGAFDRKLAADTTFAKSPRARLDFFFERSPWFDHKMNVYPVARCMTDLTISAISETAYRKAVLR
jgi:hypothetical protein